MSEIKLISSKEYRPQEIEHKWQKRWEEAGPAEAVDFDTERPKYYALVEFPYPSGQGLHIGHAFANTILDVFARKKRMSGFNVLYPMGWDAFGLPTENYAIRTGIHPRVATRENTNRFRKQMKRLALAYNWKREINTTDPEYYKWTQWIFIQLFKHGLAYKKEMPINWCPSCLIGLANEEVVNGRCERCGAEVTRKTLSQWMLRITAYADRLIDELDLVDFPESVKAAQKSWIGRTEGIIIDYPVLGSSKVVSCYTTRPDTNFGATFVVIAPDHPQVMDFVTRENIPAVKKYIEEATKKSELERTELEKEKTGVFTGCYCVNRLTDRKMPIWVADFVVASAGTGMVVGVPAHDARDFEFAKRYGFEIIPVIKPKDTDWDFERAPYTDVEHGVVINSDFLNGLDVKAAIEEITDYLVSKGWGHRSVNYHLRDWIFSRQHYWGEPIPMVYCESCARHGISWFDLPEVKKYKNLGNWDPKSADSVQKVVGWFPVPEDQLPVKLPEVENYQPSGTGASPLATITDWVETRCPHCGGPARRETDTMPNWAGSSWYFLRYCDPRNNKSLADYKKLEYWLPVDLYLGGAEHTTLHLLYSRFWHKFLNDIGAVPGKEPYAQRRVHGVVLGEDGRRMSKSRGNVSNPEDVIDKLGADTLRVYLMFMGPYGETMPWSTTGVHGCFRFLNRVWRAVSTVPYPQETSPRLERALHQLIKKVGEDIDAMKFNTAVAAMMSFLNKFEEVALRGSSVSQVVSREGWGKFVRILAPFAPYISEELWCEILGNDFSVHCQEWPEYDSQLTKSEMVGIAVQVNGKLRGVVTVSSADAKDKEKVLKAVKSDEELSAKLSGMRVEKEIFVPGRILNFVTA